MSSNTIETFFELLAAADAVTIDDGAYLSDWETAERNGEPDNQLVRFSWTDGECDFSDILTEGGIAAGVFDSEGKFVAQNHEGEPTVIRFFDIERLSSVDSGKAAAHWFWQQLLDSVETLTGIAEQHGARTLADVMFLHQAILNGGFIDHYPGESAVLEVVKSLPSAERWLKFIKVEYLAPPPSATDETAAAAREV